MTRRDVPLLLLLAVLTVACAAPAAGQDGDPPGRTRRGNLVIENVPEIPQRIVDRLFQYQAVRSAVVEDWDPAGGLLISTRFGETYQLHHVDSPGAARRQLTFFPEPIGGAAFSPDPGRATFLFTKDVGGSEFYQVFSFDTATGTATMLTDGRSRHGGVVWNRAGDRFAYYSTARNGRDWDIVTDDLDPATPPRTVHESEGTWSPIAFSPDDRRMLIGRYISANESHLYVLDLADGTTSEIDPSPLGERIAREAAVWGPGGRSVYFTSDRDTEFFKLRRLDLATREIRTITADIDWDVAGVEAADDGSRIAFTVNEGGTNTLYLLDTATDRYRAVEAVPAGLIGGLRFDRGGDRLAMTINRAVSPSDVYVLHVGGAASSAHRLERWTTSEVGGLNADRFVEPRVIEYETFDEVAGAPRRIPAFYYEPSGEGPHPVLVYIHGGPESQFRPSFSSTFQYLVSELGIAVIAPNVRGSDGYGKSYLLLDNGFKREDSVRDIGALLDWIATRPELAADRVSVYGGSYGGYMVLASLMHYGDRLRCGIEGVGISNFVTFLTNTQDYRRDLRRAEYGDERDPEMRAFLERISPASHAERITSPLLVAQGLNDPRVPVTESEQMVRRMREAGGDVWYIMAEDEGHGFAKKANRDYLYQAMMLFLETHLLDRDAVSE